MTTGRPDEPPVRGATGTGDAVVRPSLPCARPITGPVSRGVPRFTDPIREPAPDARWPRRLAPWRWERRIGSERTADEEPNARPAGRREGGRDGG